MYCKKCGKQIDDKAVICVHCGTFTDNYRPVNNTGTVSVSRNEFYAPFMGLIFSVLGIFFSLLTAIPGLILSVIQYRRAKAVFGERKYALTGIIVAAVLIGLSVLTGVVSTLESLILGLTLSV